MRKAEIKTAVWTRLDELLRTGNNIQHEDAVAVACDLVEEAPLMEEIGATTLVAYVRDWQKHQDAMDRDVPKTTDETPGEISERVSLLLVDGSMNNELRFIDVVDGLGDLARAFDLLTFTRILDDTVSEMRRNKGKG